ncbi:unnamed protein product [Rhodiola kirilowii]
MDYEQQLHDANTIRMKNSEQRNNKRRFSDEQIRSLETIFESQSKLDPRKKQQLARDLELHPRQVAIWFQNKRARYKSKQLETDYNQLRANYDSLASMFEVLNKEKQVLANQLQKLKNHLQMRQGREGEKSCGFSFDGDEEESIKAEYMTGFDEDEPTSLLNVVESGDGSLSCSAENWGGLSTDSLFDESGSSYQWWDSLP